MNANYGVTLLPMTCLLDAVFMAYQKWYLNVGKNPALSKSMRKNIVSKLLAFLVKKIIDTTAAGDSFSAGYLASRIQGEMLPLKCAALGHRLSSEVIQHRGAIISRKLVKGLFKS